MVVGDSVNSVGGFETEASASRQYTMIFASVIVEGRKKCSVRRQQQKTTSTTTTTNISGGFARRDSQIF
jgi:GTP cyclohydrolase I